MATKYSKKTAKQTTKGKAFSAPAKRTAKSTKNGSKPTANSSGKRIGVNKLSAKKTTVSKSPKKSLSAKSSLKIPAKKKIVSKVARSKSTSKKSALKPVQKRKATPTKKIVEPLQAKKLRGKPRKEESVNGNKDKPVVKANATKPVITEDVRKIHPIHANGNGIESREKSRYSDDELQEFKDLIVKKLESSRKELKYLQEQISRSSDMGDDSDARFKGLDDGTSTSEREYLSQMASRQIQYIGHLEKALIRIENKTYGICRETGKLISRERLRAVPHATLSIEAKQGKG
jgi:RNA polymerase-binding transcription factor DksA